ncbi:DNA polymerase III subunit gamma/tau [Candidatus Sumerlaeota bacterium]|nr:DNA polymerase III subunit gamma/tau [Candidatus Sumerlaeota bacterium]
MGRNQNRRCQPLNLGRVGKTTSARILAKALNCEQGPTPEPCGKCRHCLAIAAGSDMDVLEIDAASNTQVDKMRELLESAARAAFSSRFKVYIIDEVHMLSPSSFNALLKTLEEPPSHVVFIFATTEYEKIPETVRSRCALHQFRRLSSDDIVRRLTHVARAEGIKLEEAAEREVYGLIAQAAEGGMRDALVALDQILAMTGGKPDAETAQKLLGLTSQTTLAETIGYLSEGNAPKLLEMVETQVNRGRSLEKFVKGLTSFLHDVMILQAGADARMTSLSGGALDTARELGRKLSSTQIFNMLNQFFDLEERMKRSTQTRFLIEFAFLRMAVVKPVIPLEDIIDRLKALPAGSPGLAAQPRPTPTPGGAMTVSTAQGAWSEASPETTIRGFAPSSPSPRPMTAFALHDSGAEPEPDAEGAVALATAAEPSGEVGERVAEYKSAPLGVHPLAGLSHEELIEAIAPQLPDTLQFLGRYLRSAAAMRATDSALWIQWPKDDRVASRMLAKPENKKALETALARMCGRPMTVHSDFAAAAASPAPPKSKGISPARSLNDSEPPADYSYADHEGNGNGLILLIFRYCS